MQTKLINIELEINLLEYLKRNKYIDDEMYDYVINKLLNKLDVLKK